jgi:shikimate kinase
MPGGGKSTVGRHLGRLLGIRFVDSDAEIEKRLGCKISVFFQRDGEEPFRVIEQEVIADLLGLPDIVLATGGGAVLREATRRVLHERSTVVYLRSTPEELYRRLRHDTQRPLLQVRAPLLKLKQLHSERDPLYRETAHFTFETGKPSVSMLASMIQMQLELAGVVKRGSAGEGAG